MTAAECVYFFLENQTSNTRRAYQSDLETFAEYLACRTVIEAAELVFSYGQKEATECLENYEKWLIKKRGMAFSTVSRRLSCLRALFREAMRKGIVAHRPDPRRIKKLTEEERRSGSQRDMAGPNEGELTSLLRSLAARAESHGAVGSRDLAIVSLLSNPMLRRAELCSLDLADLNLNAGEAHVRILGKGRRTTEIRPLTDQAVGHLKLWLSHRGNQPGPLFVRMLRNGKPSSKRLAPNSVRYLTLAIGERAGITGGKKRLRRLSPHGLRHTGITRTARYIIKEGRPITEGMRLTGHKKAETFLRYVDAEQGSARRIANAITLPS